MWVWYCDECDELGEQVETRAEAVQGAKKHRRSQKSPGDCCCLSVSPFSMWEQVAMATLLGAGAV